MTKTKTEPRAPRIRALLAEGKTPQQIAAQLGCTIQYVYVVRYDTKRAAAKAAKRKPGRPKGSKSKSKVGTKVDLNLELNALRERMQRVGADKPEAKPLIMEYIAPTPPYGFMDRIRILFTGRA